VSNPFVIIWWTPWTDHEVGGRAVFDRLHQGVGFRVHFIIVMMRWTVLAPWEFEFPFSCSLTSTRLVSREWTIRNNQDPTKGW